MIWIFTFLLLNSVVFFIIGQGNNDKCWPNSIHPNDTPWRNDLTNDDQDKWGWIFRRSCKEQYDDYWKGISYEAYNICYNDQDNDEITVPLTYEKDTYLKHLHQYVCCNDTTSCVICGNFAVKVGKTYYLIFDLVNSINNTTQGNFSIERNYFKTGEEDNLTKKNDRLYISSQITVPPYHVVRKKFEIKITKLNKLCYDHWFEVSPQIEKCYKFPEDDHLVVNAINTGKSGVYYDKEPYHGLTYKDFPKEDRFTLFDLNDIKCNTKIMFDKDKGLSISTFSIFYDRLPGEVNYNGKDNCLDTCAEHYSCDGGKCSQCTHPGCEHCERISLRQCTKCPANTVSWADLSGNPQKCVIDYIDLTKFYHPELSSPGVDRRGVPKPQVPPAIHWRVTMEFWTYVNFVGQIEPNFKLIYKDFMSVAFEPQDSENLYVFCVPIEWLNPIQGRPNIDQPMAVSTYIRNQVNGFFMEEQLTKINSKWFYTRCAFNLDTNRMYLNDAPEYELKVPQMFDGQTNFPFQFKKFYKAEDFTDFIFDGFSGQQTYIFIRNLNLYREYMPQKIETKYYNMHEFKAFDIFPQLLYSIPFDDVTPLGFDPVDGRFIYTFISYNYFVRLDENMDPGIFGMQNYTNIIRVIEGQHLMPPRNFYRLNPLSLNKYKKDCEWLPKHDGTLDCTNAKAYCFDDERPYVCHTNGDKPYYLNLQDEKCQGECPNGWRRPPQDKDVTAPLLTDYCSVKCETTSQICPWSETQYTDVTLFDCNNGFFNLYYSCMNDNNLLSESNALQFGSTLNTHTILIPKVEGAISMKSYLIEVWIYMDLRFPRPEEREMADRVLFMTNSMKFIYGDRTNSNFGYNNIILIPQNQNDVGGFLSTYDLPNSKNWNHLMISHEYHTKAIDKKNYLFYASYGHDNLYRKATDATPNHGNNMLSPIFFEDPKELTRIIFCCNDWTVNIEACQNVVWMDAYYRHLKIWDLQYMSRYSGFYTHQFQDVENPMLKHHYSFSLKDITMNVIYDSIGGKHGCLPINEDKTHENPDNESMLNYASHFSHDEFRPNSFVDTYTVSNTLVNPKTVACKNSGCSKCYADRRCLECYEGYALYHYKCYKVGEENTDTFYTYRNPGINMPDKLELNIHKDEVSQFEYTTLFFFIKIYGFTKHSNIGVDQGRRIILFDTTDDFYLAYCDGVDESLCFYKQGRIIFQYEKFREKLFGHWVPISIASYREKERPYKLNMIQVSVFYDNLNYLGGFGDMEYMRISEFTVYNTWIGLLSDIRLFDKFLVNAWGIIKYEKINDSTTILPKYTLSLKSTVKDQCLTKNNIVTTTDAGFKIKCVEDFNPHWNKKGVQNYFSYYWEEDRYDYIGTCGSPPQPARCLGNSELKFPYTYIFENQSCDNQRIEWAQYILYKSNKDLNKNFIRCGVLEYIDYARYKDIHVESIKSPNSVFSIDFWFYTQTSRNQMKAENGKINNFDSFEIQWDYHIRIKVENIKSIADYSNNEHTYFAHCTPVISELYPENDPVTETINLSEVYGGTLDDKWTYITCGVDMENLKFFFTSKGKGITDRSFTTNNVIPLGTVSLKIKETSRNSYGVTLIRQMRLWNCYNCGLSNQHFDYVQGNFLFKNVLHCFHGYYRRGKNSLETIILEDTATELEVEIYEIDNFHGYNVFSNIGEYVRCDEANEFNYYDEKLDDCIYMFNLARLNDFQFEIPSSRTARYTVEFWFYIEDSVQLTQGINIIWQKHLSISIIRDSTNTATILGVCFPQAYRENVQGRKGLEIFDLYNVAINKDTYYYYSGSSKWHFIRCAIDQTRKVYSLNEQEHTLLAETLYGNERNYRPFRYFDIPETTSLYFENAKLNPTRIFLRSVRAYREYIDYSLDDIKYVKLENYIEDGGKNFWPLLFFADFVTFAKYRINDDEIDWECTEFVPGANCGLVYYTSQEPKVKKIHYAQTFLRGYETPYYSTYPSIYEQVFCASGMKGGDNVPCTGTPKDYALGDDGRKFYSSTFLNMEDLTEVTSCGASTARLPDSEESSGYCLFQCEDNVSVCPVSTDYTNYVDEYQCSNLKEKVYYECIDSTLIQDSSLFFSNVYSFNDILYSIKPESNRPASYYVELWFKLDTLNYNKAITQKEYYLFAPPHAIIRDDKDQFYKYSNFKMSDGSVLYNLPSINSYEWNRVIIKTQFENNKYHISIYINYNFNSPEVEITNLDSSEYDMKLQGLGFCNQRLQRCYITDGVNTDYYNLHWGVAWYRNFRVWDERISSVELIQACQVGYTEHLVSQFYYFSLSIDTIELNTIKATINGDSVQMTSSFWYHGNDYDYDMRENYSVNNFDYSGIYLGNFVNGVNEKGTDYTISSCYSSCKRCYSASSSDCYECVEGYALYEKSCKPITGFYLKTPSENPDNEYIELKTNIDDPKFNISEQNPITITVWVKYYGINLYKKTNAEISGQPQGVFPIIVLHSDNANKPITFLGYDSVTSNIGMYINNNSQPYYTKPIKEVVGQWTHYGFSVHRANATTNEYFRHMFNFMINQEIMLPIGFDPEGEAVVISSFKINNYHVALYSSVKFYSNFWFGTYGHINSISSTRNQDLIYEVTLSGSAMKTCVTSSELTDEDVFKTITCAMDYMPYEDSNNQCTSNTMYMDLDIPAQPPCGSCSSECITQCYKTDIDGCSCNYFEGLYWIAYEKPTTATQTSDPIYYCQRVDSINFAFFEEVNITNINTVQNMEMTLAFWVYFHDYEHITFEGLEITWGYHVKVTFNQPDTSGNGIVECTLHKDGIPTINNPYQMRKWYYVTCGTDGFFKKLYMTVRTETTETLLDSVDYPNLFDPIDNAGSSLSYLSIKDNTPESKFNYGFIFIRELKLYSSANYLSWNDQNYILNPDNYKYLLHYFRNTFETTSLAKASLYDEITQYSTALTEKSDRIGYNYVEGYTPLVLCSEGYIKNLQTNECELFNDPGCLYVRNDENPVRCLLCDENLYLNASDEYKDDGCFASCVEDGKYADDYLRQCRKCDDTCLTCDGKSEYECLTCDNQNRVPKLYLYVDEVTGTRQCVENCADYGLTNHLIEAICVKFYAIINIKYPDINKPVDNNNFDKINASSQTNLENAVYEWSLDVGKTIQINSDEGREMQLPNNADPFSMPSRNTLNPELDKNLFKTGYKYVFVITITDTGKPNTTLDDLSESFDFTFTMNDYPNIGKMNILPSDGYMNTNFLFTCNECTDDYTAKEELSYAFYYYPDHTNTAGEGIELRGFEKGNSEYLHTFTELPVKDNTYLIKCKCMDELEAKSEVNKTMKLYLSPTESNVSIPLKDSLSSIDLEGDLTPEQLSNRAEFLSTITVDFPKDFILNRTTITSPSLALEVTDPIAKRHDLYCNNRGTSYIIDKYLTCDCSNYFGSNCQVDIESQNVVIDVYDQLYKKIDQAQTLEFNWYILNGIHLLVKSGSVFLPLERRDLMTRSMEYVSLCMQRFRDDMMSNNLHETFFDIYNALIEYGMHKVNDLKLLNFRNANSRQPNGMYNVHSMRNSTLLEHQSAIMEDYFTSIKAGLEILMKFYATNKLEFKFRNRNINVYMAMIDEYFTFNNYFKEEQTIYEPYFDVGNCLDNVMKKISSSGGGYKIYLTSIIWKVSPFLYSDSLTNNNTSPLINIKFVDYNSGKEVFLTDCGRGNEVKMYFPVQHYLMAPRINEKRDYIAPDKQIDDRASIFNDPVYIDSKGQVFNSTPQERIGDYFVPFNFSCKYFDNEVSKFKTKGCDYTNYTGLNYIECETLHITNEYVVEHYDVYGNFHVNTRFFYLKHYKLFAWADNYKHNVAFIISFILIGTYFVLLLVYSIMDCYMNNRIGLLSWLKTNIIESNLPYAKHLNFKRNDFDFGDKQKDGLNNIKTRKRPDEYETNMDINDVNVDLNANQIAKYGRGYTKEEGNKDDNGFFKKNKHKQQQEEEFSEHGQDIMNVNTRTKFKQQHQETNGKYNSNSNSNSNSEGSDDYESEDVNEYYEYDNDPSSKAKRINNFFRVGFSEDHLKKSIAKQEQSKQNESEMSESIINNSNNDDDNEDDNDNDNDDYSNSDNDSNNADDFNPYKRQHYPSNPPRKQHQKSSHNNYDTNTPLSTPEHHSKKESGLSLKPFFNQGKQRKNINPFQEEFDVYRPQYKKPKVISTNLNFFATEANEKDDYLTLNGLNEKPKQHPLDKEVDIQISQNQDKQEHINIPEEINKNKEDLPRLNDNLTKERRLLELSRMDLFCCQFIGRNICNRHLILITFSRPCIWYHRYKRIGNFIAQNMLYLLILSICFTADFKMEIRNKQDDHVEIALFVVYCLAAEIGACLLIHLTSFMFSINPAKIRKLYGSLQDNKELALITEYEDIMKANRVWCVFGVIVQWIYILVSVYFAFGFCATYYYQQSTFWLAFVVTTGSDILLFEFLYEIFIGIFYAVRNKGRCLLVFTEFLNRVRTMKCLT